MFGAARLLLICLLALALPAQGIAAATMKFCGPAHHAQAGLSQAGLVDAAAHGHHHAIDDPAAASVADAAGPAQAGDIAQHGKLKCSACAACCMATALPTAPLALPVVEPAVEVAVVVPAAYVGPVSAGLERPPKHTLA